METYGDFCDGGISPIITTMPKSTCCYWAPLYQSCYSPWQIGDNEHGLKHSPYGPDKYSYDTDPYTKKLKGIGTWVGGEESTCKYFDKVINVPKFGPECSWTSTEYKSDDARGIGNINGHCNYAQKKCVCHDGNYGFDCGSTSPCNLEKCSDQISDAEKIICLKNLCPDQYNSSDPTNSGDCFLRTDLVPGVVKITFTKPSESLKYSSPPVISFSPPNFGTQSPKAQAILNGQDLFSIYIIDPGAGYIKAPTVTVGKDISGNVPTATAIIGEGCGQVGKCDSDTTNTKKWKCTCPSGLYDGSQCEIDLTKNIRCPTDPETGIECYNHGTCEKYLKGPLGIEKCTDSSIGITTEKECSEAANLLKRNDSTIIYKGLLPSTSYPSGCVYNEKSSTDPPSISFNPSSGPVNKDYGPVCKKYNCVCNSGWAGERCAIFAGCDVGSNGALCSNNGTCKLTAGKYECECKLEDINTKKSCYPASSTCKPYTGSDCSVPPS